MTHDEALELTENLIATFSAQKSIQDLPADTVTIYAKFLSCIPLEIGRTAIMKIIINNKFFPTIAEIKEAVKNINPLEIKAPSAEEAWAEVRKNLNSYRAPNWSHPAIEKAIKVMGYINLCHSQNPGNDMARFFKIYETYRRREIDQIENESLKRLVATVITKDVKQLPGGSVNAK